MIYINLEIAWTTKALSIRVKVLARSQKRAYREWDFPDYSRVMEEQTQTHFLEAIALSTLSITHLKTVILTGGSYHDFSVAAFHHGFWNRRSFKVHIKG